MFAKISYNDTSGSAKTTQLRAGQRLSVGASFSADIVLNNSANVAGEHAELFFNQNKCTIRNLTGKPEKLLVNSQPTKEAVLASGDLVEIGGERMSFEMESDAPSPIVVAPPVAAAAEIKSDSQVEDAEAIDQQFERHANGVAVINIDSFAELIYPILDKSKSQWNYHLICNHLQSQLGGDPPTGLNYLEAASASVTETNDLYLMALAEAKETVEPYLKYSESGAGTLAISSPSVASADIASQFKFIATWFMDPASLKFHLVNGSSLLLDKVFSLFEVLVLPNVDDAKDMVILKDPTVVEFESFIDKINGASNDLGN